MPNKSIISLLCTLCAAALPGCGAGEASVAVAETEALMPVAVALPETMDIYETLETTASIESDAEAAVLARASGEVVEIRVEEGDRVEEGQVLALLDGERLRLQMLQAKASLDMTSREYERFVNLRQRGLVSASAVEGLKFDVDALRASYELMRLNYAYTKVRAPISGVISSRDVKIGTHVDPGAPLFSITETSRLVAYLHIPQVELSRISTGDEVLVQVDAMPGHEFRARLARISPTIDTRNGTFRATVYIVNTQGLLVPGMFSRFGISFEEHADALVVPTRALVEEDGTHVVYVVEDGAAARRIVQVGIASGGVTEILAGLDAGESVVVTGQASLRDGSKVLASLSGDASSSGTG
ncbi:MAG TPA: efflux RND transporter periplasmic adaptor subunit [Woeseiaceae bacterium]|nr:efflux RND transporter periplasmic adaptor subunit [Woeseiaceae bacterium]